MKLLALLLTVFTLAASAAPSKFHTESDKAFAEAKKRKAPVLISFFGIWCPPCNELEETVFESGPFLEKSKDFVLLKLDADGSASWKLKDKYKVGGYPTVVFTDPKGGELYRVVGYRTPTEFLRLMGLVLNSKHKDLARACKSKSAEDLWRCALICQERKDKTCADAAYKELQASLKPGTPRYLEARGYFVEQAPTEDLKRDGIARLLTEFPDSPRSALWAYTYIGMFEDGGKIQPKNEVIAKVAENVPKMIASTDKDEIGVTKTDLLQIQAELLGKIGKKDESRAVWKEAAAEFTALAAQLPKGSHARGFTIERISCLEEAGDGDGALTLANEYRAKFPDEFTFHYQAAGLLHRSKKLTDAIPVAKRAYDVSYGDNRIRAATLLLKLFVTVPDKGSAKALYDSVKKEVRPDGRLEIRTHRYLKALDKAWESFAGLG